MAGTWTLNLEKSKFVPGPAPKSQTRTYADTPDGTALTVTGVAADGSAVSGQSTFKYDGKDYPITGSADYDTLSLKRINHQYRQEPPKEGRQGRRPHHSHDVGAWQSADAQQPGKKGGRHVVPQHRGVRQTVAPDSA
jgi:hypothetical protein